MCAVLRVLDLGCGDAHFGRFLLDAWARSYQGIDASSSLVPQAQTMLPGHVHQARIEDFDAPYRSLDLVVSRLALHYVDDVGAVLRRVFSALSPGGWSSASSIPSSPRAIRPRPAAALARPGSSRTTSSPAAARLTGLVRASLSSTVQVEDYVRLIQPARFRLETLREPGPNRERFADADEFTRRQRIPLFLLLTVQRPADAPH
jgi:trans-aconitate methyltransferase